MSEVITEMLVCWRNGRPMWCRACTGNDSCRTMLNKVNAMSGFGPGADPDGIPGIRNCSADKTTVMSQSDGEGGYTYVNFIGPGDVLTIRHINEGKEIVPPYKASQDALREARRMADEGRRLAEEARAEAQRMAAEAQHMIRDAQQSMDLNEFRRRIQQTMAGARTVTVRAEPVAAPREPTKLDRILGNFKKLVYKDKNDGTKGTESGSG